MRCVRAVWHDDYEGVMLRPFCAVRVAAFSRLSRVRVLLYCNEYVAFFVSRRLCDSLHVGVRRTTVRTSAVPLLATVVLLFLCLQISERVGY